MTNPAVSPILYTTDAQGTTGLAIGDRAKVIQHIGTIYNISQSGPTRITARLREIVEPILREHEFFGGRDKELQKLNTFISSESRGYFFVTGPSGFGKSALLINWVNALQAQGQLVCYHFINRLMDIASASFILKNLCQQLAAYHDLHGDLPESLDDLRALFALLLRIPPEEGKRIIVLLDGLDEAINWKIPANLFPRNLLPEGVFVVFSARELPNRNWVSELGLPKNTPSLSLDSLGIIEIADLLRKAGETAALLADDSKFTTAMHTVSQGDPFYLRFLVEDIEAGKITVNNIDAQPIGLDGYLNEWWDQLSKDVNIEKIYDLLGFLTVARGRLLPSDLAHISPISPSLSKGAWVNEELDGKLARYLTGDRINGYAISHPRFNDYLRRIIFNKDEIYQYREQLLKFCRHWQDHQSQYALSHYAGHLYDAHSTQELYSLISESWLQVQFARVYSHRAFADDVELTIITAMSETPPNLSQVVRNCLISATLGSLATKVPPEILALMVRMGQIARALGYVSLMQDRQQQVQTYMLIYEVLLARKLSPNTRDVLNLALDAAEKIDDKVIKTRTLSSIAQTLVRFKDNARAAEIARNAQYFGQSIDDKIAKERALISVAQALTQAGQFDTALEIADTFEDEATKGSALNSLALALERPEDLDRVQLASANLQDKLVQIKVWNSIAQGYTQYGDRQRASSLAHRAIEIAQVITSQEPNAPLLNIVAQTCAWASNLNGVLMIVGTITDKQLKAETLSAAAQVFAQNRERENAIRMAVDAQIGAQAIEDPQFKARVLSNIVQTLAIVHEFKRAYAVANEIKDAGAKSSALNSIIQVLIQEKSYEEAKNLSSEISETLFIGPALGSIASGLASAGQVTSALDIVDMIKDEVAKLDALSDVAQAVAETGEEKVVTRIIDRALTMMDTVKPERAKVQALSSVAQVLAQSGEVESAITITTNAWKIAQAIEDEIEKAPALINIARTFALIRQFDQALNVAQAVDDEGAKTSALNSIAQTLEEMDEREQAANAARLALGGALGLQDKWSSIIALSSVAQTLIALGDGKQAAEIVKRARADVKMVEDEQLKASALSGVVQTLVLLRQLDPALVEPMDIQSELGNEEVLGDVAQALAKTGDWHGAQEKTDQIQDKNYRVQALSSVVQALAKRGERERAAAMAKDAVELLKQVSHDRIKAQSLRSMAQALGLATEIEVIKQARSVAETIVDVGFKVLGLSSVAQAFVLAKQYEQAIDAVITAFCTARLAGREIIFQVLEETAATLATLYDQNRVSYLWPIYEKIVEVEKWWQNPKYHAFTEYSNKGGKQV